jgi:hypothetical protein
VWGGRAVPTLLLPSLLPHRRRHNASRPCCLLPLSTANSPFLLYIVYAGLVSCISSLRPGLHIGVGQKIAYCSSTRRSINWCFWKINLVSISSTAGSQ